MTPRRRALSAAMTAAIALSSPGCKRRPPPLPAASAAPVAAPSASTPLPADHALPDELAEGSEKAFGLPIPRRMSVTARFPDAVFAAGDPAPEIVANYIRERVLAAQIETGPAKTVFSHATSRTDPGRMMRIDVIGRNGATELFVRDESAPPVKEGLTTEQRWQRLGLSPDGRPLDPTHLE